MSLVSLFSIPAESVCNRNRRIARPQLRQALWVASPHCRYCGRRMARKKARLDHIWPISRGGADTTRNLALICFQCDQAKKAMTPPELLLWSIRILIMGAVARVFGGKRVQA